LTITFEAKRVGNAIVVTNTQEGRSGPVSGIDIYHMAGPDKLGVVMVRGVLGLGEHTMISGTLVFARQ